MVRRAIVVDDHAGFRRRAGKLLAAAGLDVVGEAGDCAQARRMAWVARPEAVLLDVRLPDGSGAVLADELSRLGVRVLLTSAMSVEELASQLGGHRFVPKQELNVECIRELLGP